MIIAEFIDRTAAQKRSYAQQSHSTGAGRRTRVERVVEKEWPRGDVAEHAARIGAWLRIVQLLCPRRDGGLDP